MASERIEKWHEYMATGNFELLDEQLANDVVFTSPVVHTPQQGKSIATAYLKGAYYVIGKAEKFHYVQSFDCGDKAVLEFECEIDGLVVNGVDMIRWNEDGKIYDFKVMVRPLKAINTVHKKMGEMLAKVSGKGQKSL